MTVAPALVVAATVASAAVGAYGVYAQGQAAADAADYNAKVAERDMFVSDQNRKSTLAQAAIAAEDTRRNNKRRLATIRASYGASGMSLVGSPLDVLTDSAAEGELDVQRVEYEGRVRGREGALQMLGLESSAALSRMEASSARRAGTIGAVGTSIGGAGAALDRL